MLLDIDGDTAFLMTPPGETVVRQEPNRLVTGPGGASYVEQGKVITRKTPLTFRAVRWRDGAELARLEVKDACLQAPGLDLDGRPSSGRNAQVAYADVPAWRARTLSYVPGRNARLLLAPDAELPRAPGCAAR